MSERSGDSALPADWERRDLAALYAQYTRLCRDEHERGRPVPEWLRPRETPP